MNEPKSIVVVTPCHNEENNLQALVNSLEMQALLPVAWVIVDDGSSDDTANRAEMLTEHIGWASVIRRPNNGLKRSFESKARAVNEAVQSLGVMSFAYVACVDADVMLPNSFLKSAVTRFESDPRLGVTGGRFVHPVNGQLRERKEPQSHVPGPAQVFRRETFEQVGGYQELRHGGIDTVANYMARERGWTTSTFPELSFNHTRQVGTGGGRTLRRAAFHLGQQDWDLGNLVPFELLKITKDVFERPRLIGAMCRAAGYCWEGMRRSEQSTPESVRSFIRGEQRDRIKRAGRWRRV